MIILLLVIHFIADFVLQSDNMAQNKSKSNYWLTMHVLSYIACFIILLPIMGVSVLYFILINFILHWIIDYVTSRMSSKLYKLNKRHEFFICIGFDQLLHAISLIVSYNLLMNTPLF